MKLVVNYDLMSKIQDAKGVHVLQRSSKQALSRIFLPCVFSNAISLSLNTANGMDVLNSLQICVFSNSILYFTNFLAAVFVNEVLKADIKEKSCDELILLSSKLNDLNISTNLSLLLESEIYEENLRLVLNKESSENKRGIIQTKYINVPTISYNDKQSYTSVKQEHLLGSKEYILSLDSPSKVKKLKPIMSGI